MSTSDSADQQPTAIHENRSALFNSSRAPIGGSGVSLQSLESATISTLKATGDLINNLGSDAYLTELGNETSSYKDGVERRSYFNDEHQNTKTVSESVAGQSVSSVGFSNN